MSIYYKYAPDGSKIVVLSYADDCVYWYTNKDLGKWFVDNFGKIFHMNFLEYAHWFISIRISQLKDHSASVDQAIYATSIVEKYSMRTLKYFLADAANIKQEFINYISLDHSCKPK